MRRVLISVVCCSQISRQTQQSWKFRQLYTGFGVTWYRTMGLMTTYFILIDSGRRQYPEIFSRPLLGPFLASGTAATLAWWIVWPLEYMKSQVQGRYGENLPVLQRMRQVMFEKGGFFGLYRGIIPGSIRSFFANGIAMIVMVNAQKKVSELGWRD
ncbi:PREDICTED: uncharacterized protein LOC106813808 [Priapulus caudatus]|uniref:Uncharacterized protein LOC106813808 n=1 Tax=Priapulus caudatus TaxID=37621 RepID=A0ABM1EMV0_PRICU|nr:PREDICTED: uncharacterized protein LOC106813808 [Priapulus caudatus]